MYEDSVKVMCDAWDEILVTSAFEAEAFDIEDPPMTFVSVFGCAYMTQQVSILERLWLRLKLLVSIARGKDYQLHEIAITSAEDHQELADFFKRQAKRCQKWDRKAKAKKRVPPPPSGGKNPAS